MCVCRIKLKLQTLTDNVRVVAAAALVAVKYAIFR